MSGKAPAVLLAVLLILASACSGPEAESSQENTLRIGTTSPVRAANILKDTYLALYARISNPPLMTMNAAGEIAGVLVEEYRSDEEGRVWTFRLKEELFWSDGKPVTSQDVRFSIELTGQNNPYAYWIRDNLVESQTPDERTVIFRFGKSYNRLPFELITHNILPEHTWGRISDPNTYSHNGPYLGCGPFVLQKANIGTGLLVFARNPYWTGQAPHIEKIEIHLYKNLDVLCLALEKGEVDTFYQYAATYPYANLERLRAKPNFAFLEQPDSGLTYLGFNLTAGPLTSAALREAITLALDYEEIVRLELLGHGRPASRGFVPPYMPQYVETPLFRYDPDAARSLLKKSGYSDENGDGLLEDPEGKTLSLTLPTRQRYVRTAELIRDYLRRIGIEVLPQIVDSSTWIALKEKFDYDLTISRTSPWGMYMHAGWATGYFDSRRTGEGVLRNVDDPAFHRLCDEILAAKSPEDSAELARSVQAYYSRHLPAAALYWSTLVIPYKKTFRGWVVDPLYGLYNIDTFIRLESEPHVSKRTTENKTPSN